MGAIFRHIHLVQDIRDRIWAHLPHRNRGGWYWPGTHLGYANSYTHYPGCFLGAHVHMDAFNYAHYAGWYDKAWLGQSVAYNSSYWSITIYGVLGGTGGMGPDAHGGAWTGY
jgi:hypothetical protein